MLVVPIKLLCVDNRNNSIAWKFQSENHDIGYQIVSRGNGNENVVLPFSLVQSIVVIVIVHSQEKLSFDPIFTLFVHCFLRASH